MNLTSIIILIVIVVIVVWIFKTYNTLIAQIEAVKNNEKQIDVQLDRRYKVFENLINVFKKYMDYEQTTLKDVVRLRNEAQAAKTQGDTAARVAAESQLSTISYQLSAIFEQYPDLKANQNALQLQEEIVNTENKLAFAKQALNDSIETYNATKKSALQSLLVSVFNQKLNQSFTYWQLTDEEIKAKENYQVKF